MQTFTRLTGVIIVSSGLLACSQQSSDTAPLESLQQKASYSYGVDVAVRLKQQGVELDASARKRGIADAYNG